jgi:hypothetical protein
MSHLKKTGQDSWESYKKMKQDRSKQATKEETMSEIKTASEDRAWLAARIKDTEDELYTIQLRLRTMRRQMEELDENQYHGPDKT